MHIHLPSKYYFISKFDKNHIDKLDKSTALIYRNYNKNVDKKLIIQIKKYCKIKKLKFLLSNNIQLAINLNLDGAYIPSFNSNKNHLRYSYKKNFILLGSAHNIKEIRTKELQKVNAIFLSSLFKKNKNYLGINKFKLLSSLTKKHIIALGGISNKNLKLLNLIKCFGFSGISIFE
ncbi:thiamine phosphate synthase [Candidatus Pelagibacter sp.]|nr:thiamine phosphate synthase [Candidatus Pelagibacter sp.]